MNPKFRKKLLTFFIFIFCLFQHHSSKAQNNNVPKVVTDSFYSIFPDAKEITWYNALTYCKATFKNGQSQIKSTFSLKGELIKNELMITFNQLPDTVQASFKSSKYANIPIKEIIKVEEKRKVHYYRITVMKGAVNKTSLQFSTGGKLVSERNFL